MVKATSKGAASAGIQLATSSVSQPTIDRAISEIQGGYEMADGQLKAAAALIDAAAVLCALERAPVHQDTHPSHDIRTGGGYAHGLRLKTDTLPTLLEHALFLVEMSANDFDVGRVAGEIWRKFQKWGVGSKGARAIHHLNAARRQHPGKTFQHVS